MNQKEFMNTKNGIIDIHNAMKEAEKDDTPFPVVTDDGLKVVGDANKTENKARDYKVTFRFPKEMIPESMAGQVTKEVGNYRYVEIEYNDVHVTPRHDLKILASIMDILPLFRELQEDGNVKERSLEDLLGIIRRVPQETIDSMYTLVASFLDVDEDIAEYMTPTDVMSRIADFIRDFPEVFNEADVFFG